MKKPAGKKGNAGFKKQEPKVSGSKVPAGKPGKDSYGGKGKFPFQNKKKK